MISSLLENTSKSSDCENEKQRDITYWEVGLSSETLGSRATAHNYPQMIWDLFWAPGGNNELLIFIVVLRDKKNPSNNIKKKIYGGLWFIVIFKYFNAFFVHLEFFWIKAFHRRRNSWNSHYKILVNCHMRAHLNFRNAIS